VPRQGHCPLLLRTGAPRLQWQQLFSLVLPSPVERRALRRSSGLHTFGLVPLNDVWKAWCGRWPVFFPGVVSVLFSCAHR
jgi:hypothetical protein